MGVRGTRILLVFFSIFTVASLLIPAPMFPGNMLSALVGAGVQNYMNILSAFLNGAAYGVILWLVFVGIGKKLKE